MSRYIDADELVYELTFMPIDLGYREYEDFLKIVNEQPTADVVERKHGEWIACQDGKYHCSRCDDVAPKGYRWNYCANCGADMRERREDERNI